METRLSFYVNDCLQEHTSLATRLEKLLNSMSQRINLYCLDRLARDLEVRNRLKHIENNAAYPSASACAADVSLQLERLDE